MQADTQLAVIFKQTGIGQGLEAQLVGGVRGVGDELPQEDFLMGVEAVGHQVKQLLNFGLKPVGFLVNGFCHLLFLR